MRLIRVVLILVLAAVFFPIIYAESARSQEIGIYSSLTTDDETGQVFVYAETYADYNVGYYYETYVATDLGVWPSQGQAYSTCLRSVWSTGGTAMASCQMTLDQPTTLNLVTYHNIDITYNVWNFYYYCYIDYTCSHWWDQYDIWDLGLRGVELDEDGSWYCEAVPYASEEQRTVNAVADRPGTICSRPRSSAVN
jgi:hypothetical protein